MVWTVVSGDVTTWTFFHNLARPEAEALLLKNADKGDWYLLRKASRPPGAFAFSWVDAGAAKHNLLQRVTAPGPEKDKFMFINEDGTAFGDPVADKVCARVLFAC